MNTIIALLSLVSLILFITGLFSPNKSLFWFKGEKTRLKSSLVYIVMFVLLAIIGDRFFPFDKSKTTETQLEETSNSEIQNSEIVENNNIKEWFALSDKKKEKFIEENIKGSWQQIMQVALINEDNESEIFINKNFKSEYKSTDDYVSLEEFIPKDGFFDSPQYISKTQSEKGEDEYKTSWQVEKNEIVLATGTSDQNNEQVIFLSENLCIRKKIEPLTGDEFTIYFAKIKNNVISDYQPELEAFINKDVQIAYQLMLDGVSNIASSNSINGYQTIYEGYNKLKLLSNINSNIDIETDEVVKSISENLVDVYPLFISDYSKSFGTEIEQFRKKEDLFVFFEKYTTKMDEMKSLINIGNAFKQDNTSLKKEVSIHKKDYEKLFNEYLLYGDISQEYLMELAAEFYIEQNAKDPTSIEIIDDKSGLIGKTKKGIAYQVSYRGKNSFGALVINSEKLLLKWNIKNKTYYVAEVL